MNLTLIIVFFCCKTGIQNPDNFWQTITAKSRLFPTFADKLGIHRISRFLQTCGNPDTLYLPHSHSSSHSSIHPSILSLIHTLTHPGISSIHPSIHIIQRFFDFMWLQMYIYFNFFYLLFRCHVKLYAGCFFNGIIC